MKRILINGLGRSGTSWVYKTFDHHPGVFASFEPEAMVSEPLMPHTPAAEDLTALDEYVEGVFSSQALRAMRKRPILAKEYRSRMAHLLRLGMIYGASSLEKLVPFLEKSIQKAPIPDLANRPDLVQVAKCVSGQYQLPSIAARNPNLKVIYIIRHPCGQTFSHMNGLKKGRMHKNYLPLRPDLERMFDFEKPAEKLVEADFSQLEINAYRWAVFCDLNYSSLSKQKNARVIRYEDICADPVSVFRELFEWCGLDWHPDCARFIKKSTNAKSDTKGYHTLIRSPTAAANKWKSEMPVEERETVASICRSSSAAALFPDL